MCLNPHVEMGLSLFNALCIKTCNHCHVTFLLRLDSLCCNNTFCSLQAVSVSFPLLIECGMMNLHNSGQNIVIS